MNPIRYQFAIFAPWMPYAEDAFMILVVVILVAICITVARRS